jgi:hypothetical protein
VLCAEFFNYATPRLAGLFFEAVLPSIGFVIADDQRIDGSGRGAAGVDLFAVLGPERSLICVNELGRVG